MCRVLYVCECEEERVGGGLFAELVPDTVSVSLSAFIGLMGSDYKPFYMGSRLAC